MDRTSHQDPNRRELFDTVARTNTATVFVRKATEVRRAYRKVSRKLVERGRVKLAYRKESQRNVFGGLAYTPVRLDARFGYLKPTGLAVIWL
jgi:hypothetical protein